jgi:hypothetical protein
MTKTYHGNGTDSVKDRPLCPVCGFNYGHIRRVVTDNPEANVLIAIDGECEHSWTVAISKQKGSVCISSEGNTLDRCISRAYARLVKEGQTDISPENLLDAVWDDINSCHFGVPRLLQEAATSHLKLLVEDFLCFRR